MPWLPSTAVRGRYRGLFNSNKPISPMTLDRWVKRGLLPPPVYIGGRRYWDSGQLDAYDEARRAVAQPTARQILDGKGAA